MFRQQFRDNRRARSPIALNNYPHPDVGIVTWAETINSSSSCRNNGEEVRVVTRYFEACQICYLVCEFSTCSPPGCQVPDASSQFPVLSSQFCFQALSSEVFRSVPSSALRDMR